MKFSEIEEWRKCHNSRLPESEWSCRYCDSFTGSDDTGCAGRSKPCRHFCLDTTTTPASLLVDPVDPDYVW